ncbi:MAG: MBL fold metallo-hydrolase [Deltaproteobacteria bacterium]|nr:MBL fold metallo-hydrolase [Deltaproteobacteria bacterium]
MRVHFLGSGDAFGSGGRNQTAYLLEDRSHLYLLDCGPSTLPALRRARLDPANLDAVILSHLHGDHFGGLPFFFIHYLYDRPRTRPLVVAGPPGTEERVRALMGLMYGEKELPFAVFFEMEPDTVTAVAGAEVLAFRVPHQTDAVSLGLRVTAAGRTVLFSGDSSWTDQFVTHSRGADLFICECCFYDDRSTSHMSYVQVAAHREQLECKRLILTHMGEEMLARRRSLPIRTAEDGMVVDL